MSHWWNDSTLGTPLKVLVLIAVGLALVFNASWLVPIALLAGVIYAIYYGIWVSVRAWQDPENSPSPDPSISYSPTTHGFRRRKWQDAARELLARRTPAEKVAELCGSYLLAAFVTLVLTVVMMVVGAGEFRNSTDSLAFFAWFASVGTLGAWAILGAGKLMEGRSGEPVRRRFVMLIVGLLLGAFAFVMAQMLMLPLRDVMDFPSFFGTETTTGVYDSNRNPMLPAYLAYFAGTLVALRWWKQVDPLRQTRLSIWATGMCVLWAAVLEMFWHFPQPWGLMLAATISIAAQLSAPWFNSQQRTELRQQLSRS